MLKKGITLININITLYLYTLITTKSFIFRAVYVSVLIVIYDNHAVIQTK